MKLNFAYAEVIRNYRQRGLDWVRELGVDKVIYRANRILRKWEVSHSIALLRIPYRHVSVGFNRQRFPRFALGIEGSNIPIAYIFPENSEVICDWEYPCTFQLPAVSKGLIHPVRANYSLPFLISLPTALAIATFTLTFPIPKWHSEVFTYFDDPRYLSAIFMHYSSENQWVSKIVAVFKERVAKCTVTKCQVGREDTESRYEFQGKYDEVIREIRRAAALLTI